MTRLKEVELGQAGIDYVRACLRQGTGLCAKVLCLSFLDGVASAPLPEHTGLDRAEAFEVGGIMSRRDAIAWFVEHIKTSWPPEEERTLVLQDIWAKSGDPVVRGSPHKKFFENSNVYYFFESENLNSYVMQNAISSMVSYLFIAFLSRFPLRYSELPSDHVIGEKLIEQLATDVQEVFVGAYDQEGIVVWRR